MCLYSVFTFICVPNHKLPPELCVSMIHQTWMLFEKMWSTHNKVRHSPSSALLRQLDTKYIEEFQAYKVTQNEWFHATDGFMVDYSLHDFLSWPRECRRTLLSKLVMIGPITQSACYAGQPHNYHVLLHVSTLASRTSHCFH